jgi:hypothetical protein
VPPTCKIAGSSDAAHLLGGKPLLLNTANGCLFSVGTKDLLVGEFSGTRAVGNFRLVINPKTKVVSHDIPPGAGVPGSPQFTRIDGTAAEYMLSSTGEPPQPEAVYYAMKERRVFQVVASGMQVPTTLATAAMRTVLERA